MPFIFQAGYSFGKKAILEVDLPFDTKIADFRLIWLVKITKPDFRGKKNTRGQEDGGLQVHGLALLCCSTGNIQFCLGISGTVQVTGNSLRRGNNTAGGDNIGHITNILAAPEVSLEVKSTRVQTAPQGQNIGGTS